MKKIRIFVLEKLVAILLLGVTLAGCTTTRYGLEITNVSRTDIREVYIRNSGTTHWGSNIAGSMHNIDISRYSQRVDIRVVDTRGIVYSRHNVPFNFVETGQTRSMNNFAALGIVGAGLGTYYLISNLMGE